ncbi:MAG: HEPN domain-containing protein [Deltaproteobacteria bacterium]|nr:HEPN domain-containing protein [Deltaproteobacteria bacterium]
MTGANKKLNIDEEVSVGERAYREALALLEKEFHEGATSRLYYAAFHLAHAVLLSEGLQPKSHKGALFLFKKHFVETGHFEPRYSQIIARAEKYREEADYRHDMSFSKELVEQTRTEVKEFMEKCLSFLKSQKLVD